MTDKLIDFSARLRAKEEETVAYFQHMDRIALRQMILSKAIEEMAEFSTAAEIAKTLRFAVDVLEGRED